MKQDKSLKDRAGLTPINWKRWIAWLVVVAVVASWLPSYGYVNYVAAATQTGEAFDQNPIQMTNGSENPDKTEYYTTETAIGRISLDGVQLSGPLDAPYIDISVPAKHVEVFSIPAAELIDSVEDLVKNEEIWTKRVNLSRFDTTTKGSFPYTLRMKHRETPRGYVFAPDVRLYTSDNLLIASSQDFSFTTKVDDPVLYK